MKPFSSRHITLPFVASHQYAPHGNSQASQRSKEIVIQLKQDGFVKPAGGEEQGYINVLDRLVERIAQLIPSYPFLAEALSARTLLVPIPGHSPLKDPSSVWPAARLCAELSKKGFGVGPHLLVERVSAVQKSAVAGPGQRPSPEEHYRSIRIKDRPLISFDSITLVDDVITRGSTFVGVTEKLKEVYQDIPLHCFAVVRTVPAGDITTMICPTQGTISCEGGQPVVKIK